MRLGRVFLNNRYYDPQTGVFLSVDPLVGSTGDPYLYAGGNPTTRSDPSGLCFWDTLCDIGGDIVQDAEDFGQAGFDAVATPFKLAYDSGRSWWSFAMEDNSYKPKFADKVANGAAYMVRHPQSIITSCAANVSSCAGGLAGGALLTAGTSSIAELFTAEPAIGVPSAAAAQVTTRVGRWMSPNELATEAAGSEASSLIGTSYGRAGTVVENPGISIKGFGGSVEPGHALNQIISRGVSPQSLLTAVSDPTVVLQQAGNRYLYLTTDTAVVITGDGQVVTAWTSNEFLSRVQQILSDARGG